LTEFFTPPKFVLETPIISIVIPATTVWLRFDV
jgi:hypothetical protein